MQLKYTVINIVQNCEKTAQHRNIKTSAERREYEKCPHIYLAASKEHLSAQYKAVSACYDFRITL